MSKISSKQNFDTITVLYNLSKHSFDNISLNSWLIFLIIGVFLSVSIGLHQSGIRLVLTGYFNQSERDRTRTDSPIEPVTVWSSPQSMSG